MPGKPVSVHFSVRAASRVLAGAGRGLGARLETGGLLLGCAGAGPGVAVTVENVLEVPIEYASGPIYRLSERDKENLRITLRLWERSPGRSIYAVGFYRTQARAGLSLAPSDLELFSEFFPEPYCVALLIRPQPRRAALAGLFYRENGEVTAVPGCLELPPPARKKRARAGAGTRAARVRTRVRRSGFPPAERCLGLLVDSGASARRPVACGWILGIPCRVRTTASAARAPRAAP